MGTDQYISSLKGRIPNTKGKENDQEKYSGGTIYVDNGSGYIHVENQVFLNATEIISGKHRFERLLDTYGVDIKQFRGDKGIFNSAAYKNELSKNKQTIVFSGVGAQH